jgi:hypothetical protein
VTRRFIGVRWWLGIAFAVVAGVELVRWYLRRRRPDRPEKPQQKSEPAQAPK